MKVDTVRRAAVLMRQAADLLNGGPLEYYLTELAAAHDLLMDRFAPFKVGDRVKLTKSPDAPGWTHCRHFLVPGALGTVMFAECGSRGFMFFITFDDDSWIDETGFKRPIGTRVYREEGERLNFQFGEGWLEPADCTKEQQP